jgi:hypothetical protein
MTPPLAGENLSLNPISVLGGGGEEEKMKILVYEEIGRNSENLQSCWKVMDENEFDLIKTLTNSEEVRVYKLGKEGVIRSLVVSRIGMEVDPDEIDAPEDVKRKFLRQA